MAINRKLQTVARRFHQALEAYKRHFLLEDYPMIEFIGSGHPLWDAFEQLQQQHQDNDHGLPFPMWVLWRRLIHALHEPPEHDYYVAYRYVDQLTALVNDYYRLTRRVPVDQHDTKPSSKPSGNNYANTAAGDPAAAPKFLVEFDAATAIWTACGKPKGRLTPERAAVLKALLEAGPGGLRKEELQNRSGKDSAVGIIRRLRNSDQDWARAIVMPGRAWNGGYRVRYA